MKFNMTAVDCRIMPIVSCLTKELPRKIEHIIKSKRFILYILDFITESRSFDNSRGANMYIDCTDHSFFTDCKVMDFICEREKRKKKERKGNQFHKKGIGGKGANESVLVQELNVSCESLSISLA